jgi:uroporphyrinogen-III synthase
MAPLHGIGVLVTRPTQQAMPLCRLLESQGAHTMRLPALEIKPCDASQAGAHFGAIEAFDFVVFTSANAVRFGSPLLQRSGAATLAAIGPATARALTDRGYAVALLPEHGFTSEALLAEPRFGDLAGQRILLIKGAGGRPTLEQELTRRGAEVFAIDVYQRVAANPSAAELATVHAAFAADRLHVITATSLDVGQRLLDIVPAELHAQLQKAHWLVPSERVAAGLRERGLHAPLLRAASAEDQDLVAALGRWRSGASRA